MKLTEEEKQKIIQQLTDKKMKAQCPMCSSNQFIIADGYFNQPLQGDLKGFSIGGPSIPTIAIICSQCGFVSQHAVGVLGLLPTEGK